MKAIKEKVHPTLAVSRSITMKKIAESKGETPCKAFVHCQNKATTTLTHPIMGNVSCCERCKKRLS